MAANHVVSDIQGCNAHLRGLCLRRISYGANINKEDVKVSYMERRVEIRGKNKVR